MEFSKRSMRMLIKGETDLRVSESAGVELGEFIERFAEEVSENAIEIAREQGYQTVKQEQVKQALEDRTSLNASSSLTFQPGE